MGKKEEEKMNQRKEGIKVEMEHKGLGRWIDKFEHKHHKLPSDKDIAKKISEEHLKEDKNYYSKLKKAKL